MLNQQEESVNLCKVAAILLAIVSLITLPAFAVSCESLSNLKLPDTTITSALTVSAGEFTPPNPMNQPVPPMFKKLPAFCRVMAEVKPGKDSDIKMEVWMPVAGFNVNFRAQSNGGFAGSISYAGMAGALSQG